MSQEAFCNAVLLLAGEGQELETGDRMLINQQVAEFCQQYLEATGELPRALANNIMLFAPRIEALGFSMPRIDKWRGQDLKIAQAYLDKHNK